MYHPSGNNSFTPSAASASSSAPSVPSTPAAGRAVSHNQSDGRANGDSSSLEWVGGSSAESVLRRRRSGERQLPGSKRRRTDADMSSLVRSFVRRTATAESSSSSRGDPDESTRRSDRPIRGLVKDVVDMHYQLTEERTRRGALEKDVSQAQAECRDVRRQNEALRQEARCLLADKTILSRQVEDLTVALSAVEFDSERYKNKLEEHRIEVPTSVYDEVEHRRSRGESIAHYNNIPEVLAEAAALDEESKGSFLSVHSLVNTVKDLQLRLREGRVGRAVVADERINELEELVESVERKLTEGQEARQLLRQQSKAATDALGQKINSLAAQIEEKNREIEGLREENGKLRTEELSKIEQMKLREYELRIHSLTQMLSTTNEELGKLRKENGTLLASGVVAGKEIEYYASTLGAERERAARLLRERDELAAELNAQKSQTSQSATEVLLLSNRADILQRKLNAKEEEARERSLRAQEAQAALAEEQARWDKSLQEALRKATQLEMDHSMQAEKMCQLETALQLCTERLRAETEVHGSELARREREMEAVASRLQLVESMKARLAEELKIAEAQKTAVLEEKQALAVSMEKMELQASILKHKHPQLDFGVLEDDLQRYESERKAILSTNVTLTEQVEELERSIELKDELLEELRQSLQTLTSAAEDKQAQTVALTEALETAKRSAADNAEELAVLKTQLTERDASVRDQEAKIRLLEERLRIIEESSSSECTAKQNEIERLQREILDTKEQFARAQLEIENSSHTYRLEIQAHSRDVERMALLQRTFDHASEEKAAEVEALQQKLKVSETRLTAVLDEARASRRREELSEAQLRSVRDENVGIRKLLYERLDQLELQEEGIAKELAQRLRAEEVLRREAEEALLYGRRADIELQGSVAQVAKLKEQLAEKTAELNQVRLDLDSQHVKPLDEAELRQLAELRLRCERLEREVRFATEMKGEAEIQLSDALSALEPLRREDGALRGELATVKRLLEMAQAEANTYRTKYIDMAKGYREDAEKREAEARDELQSLREALSLELQKSQETAQTLAEKSKLFDAAEAEKMSLKSDADRAVKEVERTGRELGVAKAQVQTLQSQVESLQAQQRSQADNVEIQKRYQLQLSQLQRLVQTVNAEKDQLRSEVTTLQSRLLARQSQITSLEQELSSIQTQGPPKGAAPAKGAAPTGGASVTDLETFSNLLDETVRLGVTSLSYALSYLGEETRTGASVAATDAARNIVDDDDATGRPQPARDEATGEGGTRQVQLLPDDDKGIIGGDVVGRMGIPPASSINFHEPTAGEPPSQPPARSAVDAANSTSVGGDPVGVGRAPSTLPALAKKANQMGGGDRQLQVAAATAAATAAAPAASASGRTEGAAKPVGAGGEHVRDVREPVETPCRAGREEEDGPFSSSIEDDAKREGTSCSAASGDGSAAVGAEATGPSLTTILPTPETAANFSEPNDIVVLF